MQNIVPPAVGYGRNRHALTGCCSLCKGTRIYCKTMAKADYFEFFYKKVGQNIGGLKKMRTFALAKHQLTEV